MPTGGAGCLLTWLRSSKRRPITYIRPTFGVPLLKGRRSAHFVCDELQDQFDRVCVSGKGTGKGKDTDKVTLLNSVVCGCRFLVTRRLSRRWQRCTSQAGPHHRLMQPPMRGPQPEDPELSAVDCGYILQEPHGRTAHGRRAWAHGAWAGMDSGALASGAITDRLIGGRNMTRRGPRNSGSLSF